MSSLKPIKLLPARERVASALRKAILTQELKPDEEITLEGIATKLGVSSTPVREAFQILAADGLIRLRHNKGATVVGFTQQTIRDHYETRAVLERFAAIQVCLKNADISGVENAYERSLQAVKEHDYATYSNCNQAFHMEIWTAAGNNKMRSILSSLWNGLSMGHKVTEDEYARISMAEHALILDALRGKDAARAGDEMERHILRSMENILTHYTQDSSD